MFEKLKRAKSFIHRSKYEQERELDLSEYSHLRRNVAISSEVLEQQKRFPISKEHMNDTKKRYSSGQIDRTQEQLNDKVLQEFHTKINLSKGDGKISGNFDRKNPAYLSERTHLSRNYLRKKDKVYSINSTARQTQPLSNTQQLKFTSSDFEGGGRLHFDRQSPAYMSERTSRQGHPMKRQMQLNIERSRRANSSETNSPRLSDRQYQPPKRLIQLNGDRNTSAPLEYNGRPNQAIMQKLQSNFDRSKNNTLLENDAKFFTRSFGIKKSSIS